MEINEIEIIDPEYYLNCHVPERDHIFICEIQVNPDLRNRGIASKVISRIKNAFNTITLSCRPNLKSFWEKQGFIYWKESDYNFTEETSWNLYYMEHMGLNPMIWQKAKEQQP